MTSTYLGTCFYDYRTGPHLTILHEKDDECDKNFEENAEIVFELDHPINDFGAYIVKDCMGSYKILASDEFLDQDDADNFLLQAYSKINGCTPFVVSGYTTGYSQTGEYGDEIEITNDKIKNMKVSKLSPKHIYGITIDNEGEIWDTLCIKPAE